MKAKRFVCILLICSMLVSVIPAATTVAALAPTVMDGVATLYSITYDFSDKPWEDTTNTTVYIKGDIDFAYPQNTGHNYTSPARYAYVKNSDGAQSDGVWGYFTVTDGTFRDDVPIGLVFDGVTPIDGKVTLVVYVGHLAYDLDEWAGAASDASAFYSAEPYEIVIDVEANPSGTIVVTPESGSSTVQFNGSTYQYFSDKVSWIEAKEACEKLGGHLVAITSAEEQAFLDSKWGSYWIGATDEASEGEWVWVTGEVFSFANWTAGEPNNDYNGTEHYAMAGDNGRWDDRRLKNDAGGAGCAYVCEWDGTGSGSESDKTQTGGFSAQKDGWSFVNGHEGFQYPEKYAIPKKRYEEVFGTSYVAAAERQNGKYYRSMMPTWGGNCFGMSATAIMFYSGKLNWSSYDDLYENAFEAVNDYFYTLNYHKPSGTLQQYVYTSSGEDKDGDPSGYCTPITKLIERYQILQMGSNNYAVGAGTTYGYLDDTFWELDTENSKEYPGHTTEGIPQPARKVEIYKIRENGTYISNLLDVIKNSNDPMYLGLQFNGGGHAIVIRTDKQPEDMGNGWWRVYVYDPNTPYLNESLLPSGSMYRYYYYNYLLEIGNDRYIELNPNENKWRYFGSVNSGEPSDYWGCDENGNVKMKGKEYVLSNGTIMTFLVPEYIVCGDLSMLPADFSNKEKWTNPYNGEVSIAFACDSSFSINDVDGAVICEVIDGNVVLGSENVGFVPYIGYVEGIESNYGGRLIIPYNEFQIKYIDGSDISIIENDSAVNLASDDKVSLNVNMPDKEIQLSGNINSSEVALQITEIYSANEYTSVNIVGTLDGGDGLTVQFSDDTLNIENQIDGGSILDVYTDYETNTSGQYITTLKCNDAETEIPDVREIVSVSDIKLNSNQITLIAVGAAETLTVTIIPSDATNQTVTWTSSNPSVATVDSNGTVTAVSNGTATITATTEDGGFTAECLVTEDIPVAVSGISVTPTEVTLTSVGETANLTATVAPSDATNKSVKWTSSDETVATVSEMGVVTAVAAGTATITATTEDGDHTAACVVTVAIESVEPPEGGDDTDPPEGDNNPEGGDKPEGGDTPEGGGTNTPDVDDPDDNQPGDTNPPGGDNPEDGNNPPEGGASGSGGDGNDSSGENDSENGNGGSENDGGDGGSSEGSGNAGDSGGTSSGSTSSGSTGNSGGAGNAGGSESDDNSGSDAGSENDDGTVDTGDGESTDTVEGDATEGGSSVTETPWINPFTDVAEDAWYYGAVEYVARNSIMNGYDATTFAPDDELSRAMLAQILYNLEGRPEALSSSDFDDVIDGAWYVEAIAWAAEQGYMEGHGNGKFGPDDSITREQAAAVLYRYAMQKGYDTTARGDLSAFADADTASEWARDALEWAVAVGHMQGYNGRLTPADTATRAEIATLLQRFLEHIK